MRKILTIPLLLLSLFFASCIDQSGEPTTAQTVSEVTAAPVTVQLPLTTALAQQSFTPSPLYVFQYTGGGPEDTPVNLAIPVSGLTVGSTLTSVSLRTMDSSVQACGFDVYEQVDTTITKIGSSPFSSKIGATETLTVDLSLPVRSMHSVFLFYHPKVPWLFPAMCWVLAGEATYTPAP